MSQPRLPFLAMLNLPDLSKLMNDPVSHDPTWPPVPTKLPSDIPKFEGKNGEDPGEHVTTFHLWCSSNSLNHDSIRLRLFQCTLIGVASQWYIELPRGTYGSFNQLVMAFLNHFQLPIRYDVGLKLLSTLRQDTATHISDHIQEWRRWRWLIKTPIPPTFLLEWFLKSLHPPISKDVATSGVSNEEEAIFRAQQLDLIYAQSGMLYHLLPEAPRSNYDPRKKPRPHADGIVGSANVKSTDSAMKSVGGQLRLHPPNPPSRWMYILCNRRKTQMVTNNQMGIKGKVETIVRVGKMVTNPRTKIIMGSRMIMLERERKRNVR
jgi:hypothetical protein